MNQHQLINTSYNLSLIIAKEMDGEPFHPAYKKDRELFAKLIGSDTRTERKLKKYFHQFARDRLPGRINWYTYTQQLYKGSVIDDLIKVDWVDEAISIRVILTDTLLDALVAGGQYTERDLETPIGFGKDYFPATEALRKHVIKLSGALSDTTKDLIKHSLKTSISLGESTDQAAKRLTAYIDDPKRAAKIAHTESVRAFTQGQLAVAHEIGAKKKEWSATLNACKICSPLDGKIVGIDDEFAPGISAPPDSHPFCRCLIRIRMK